MNIRIDSEDLAELIAQSKLLKMLHANGAMEPETEPSTALEDLAAVNHQEMVWRKWGEALPNDEDRSILFYCLGQRYYDIARVNEEGNWVDNGGQRCSELNRLLEGGIIWMYAPKVSV